HPTRNGRYWDLPLSSCPPGAAVPPPSFLPPMHPLLSAHRRFRRTRRIKWLVSPFDATLRSPHAFPPCSGTYVQQSHSKCLRLFQRPPIPISLQRTRPVP